MAEKYVDWKLMENFMVDAFVGYGVPREDAEICVDVLKPIAAVLIPTA